MSRTDLHFKVVVEHEPEEKPEKLAAEIARAIERVYGVRSATLSTAVQHEE